jgi:hypothetical protein
MSLVGTGTASMAELLYIALFAVLTVNGVVVFLAIVHAMNREN